jgi:hypothetical protein
MAERDNVSTPVADVLGLRDVITGLARDLQDLRDRKISPTEGLARAAVAKQIWNGVRLYIDASKQLERQARPVPDARHLEADRHD